MTREILVEELQIMQKSMERTADNIVRISSDLADENRLLRQLVKEYGEKRAELFKQELLARGMTLCTYCHKKIAESETEFLLVQGREKFSCGYEGGEYSFRGFSKLHRACPTCRENAADRHGWKGEYDSLAKDQVSFCAFRVEKRDDGYYARKFGHWAKLDEKNYENRTLNELSGELDEQLAEEWNLPPRIDLVSQYPRDGKKLVIHERAAPAEAS